MFHRTRGVHSICLMRSWIGNLPARHQAGGWRSEGVLQRMLGCLLGLALRLPLAMDLFRQS